ncbi:Ubiquitin carboxyl-terminal hydrolase 23 [Nosema bombycis CQ1]|uniref:ubiquitinyl hydrolase 1 n=1 Tax=Nosema bombycis (strain CQ1 / CVCC 102059) TaxID=578461 RepID=R0KT44_NOSB1|nr:Ubiquitin carboxyl-terminal hydrolase 23 [Nosema bombycis CQ1]|eukprot:EOB13956.1 Ubiquitin carboxyl-terminal hydrolase 23 [Nosema bombycis CQ1]
MSECLHSLCENNIKKKLFYCQKKVKKETLCCNKCTKKEDLIVCLRSMIVYCKNENHYLKKHHVLFYDMEKEVMICTYCDKITHVATKNLNKDPSKKLKSNLKNNFDVTDEDVKKNEFTLKNDENSLLCKFIELPRFPHKVLQGNIIKGFQNLGNTCYINSLFHILINISKFKRGIINEDHPIQSCGTCIICNIKLIFKKMNTEKDLTLKHLVNCIMNFSSEYKNDDQHDIHTLYLNVVENIQKYTNKIEGNSFIDQLFYGNMNSTLRCLSCDFKRHTIEAFCSISLNHTKNLKESLSEYFQDEHMEDKLHCLNCKDHTVFSKSLEVIQIPEILVIHILRFEFINTITKINNGIEIYEKIEFGYCNYVLKGFVQHRGSIEQGHYVSYIRFGTLWYEFDDNNVRKLLHKNVPFQDAYLLFYVKDKNNV